MTDDPTPQGEPRTELVRASIAPARALTAPRPPVGPAHRGRLPLQPELSQLARLVEEAAGLTLDVLDLAGDMIAARLGLRDRTRSGQSVTDR